MAGFKFSKSDKAMKASLKSTENEHMKQYNTDYISLFFDTTVQEIIIVDNLLSGFNS